MDGMKMNGGNKQTIYTFYCSTESNIQFRSVVVDDG